MSTQRTFGSILTQPKFVDSIKFLKEEFESLKAKELQGTLTTEEFNKKNHIHRIVELIQEQQDKIIHYDKITGNNSFSGGEIHVDIQNAEKKNGYILEIQRYLTSTEELRKMYTEATDKSSEQALEQKVREYIIDHGSMLDGKDIEESIDILTKAVLGFGILDEEINPANEQIEEIQIYDYNDIHVIGVDPVSGKAGQRIRLKKSFTGPRDLEGFVNRLIAIARKYQPSAQNVTQAHPVERIRIGTTRITIVGGELAKRAPVLTDAITNPVEANTPLYTLTIRKQKAKPFTMQNLLDWGSIDEYGCLLLKYFYKYGVSMLNFGGTNTGKTATSRAFMEFVPKDLHLISIAETDEMNLNVLDTREYLDEPGPDGDFKNPNYLKGYAPVSTFEVPDLNRTIIGDLKGFRAMINVCLTFTPDIIVLQECKGAEIVDILNAAVAGCQVVTTTHVKDSGDVLKRIKAMYNQESETDAETIYSATVSAFPVIIHFELFKDGSRKVSEISELVGYTKDGRALVRPLYKFEIESNTLEYDPISKSHKLKMQGRHKSVCSPLSPRLLSIMRKNGLLDEEVEILRKAYKGNDPIEEDSDNPDKNIRSIRVSKSDFDMYVKMNQLEYEVYDM